MDEARVYHGIGSGYTTAQAIMILQVAAVYLSAGGGEGCSSAIGAGQAEDLMACSEELPYDGGTYKSRSAGHKYFHVVVIILIRWEIAPLYDIAKVGWTEYLRVAESLMFVAKIKGRGTGDEG